MRRGESKAKNLKRGGRTRSVAAKPKTRAGRKDASADTFATKLAAKARELDEALQQQAATAEVLKVISNSPGDLPAVFDTILANATRLCDAVFGNLSLYDGYAFHFEASYNPTPAYVELRKREPF